VSVDLEGEGRPRRLNVVIRRVDIIPIASLQRFMRGQDEDLAYHALQASMPVLAEDARCLWPCLKGARHCANTHFPTR
jgi:hypothetical protein